MSAASINPEQLWLVLVASGPGKKTLEHWIAPEGSFGYRKILRQSNPKRRAVAAIAYPAIGSLGVPGRGWWCALQKRFKGPEFALFRMHQDTGLVALEIVRAKSAEKAAKQPGNNIVGVYPLDALRDSVRSMRRILDGDEKLAHFNVMLGTGHGDEFSEEMNIRIRPDKWTEPEMGA